LKDFKELKVWEKAHEMALKIYQVTKAFPSDERFGLASQLRRAAASIGANIDEGCGRRSDGDLTCFLQIARGSASELEYHPLLSRDLRLLAPEHYQALQSRLVEVQRMLTALVQSAQPIKRRRPMNIASS
jgi:four helix bundle protein